jgi:hypothetical protein
VATLLQICGVLHFALNLNLNEELLAESDIDAYDQSPFPMGFPACLNSSCVCGNLMYLLAGLLYLKLVPAQVQSSFLTTMTAGLKGVN